MTSVGHAQPREKANASSEFVHQGNDMVQLRMPTQGASCPQLHTRNSGHRLRSVVHVPLRVQADFGYLCSVQGGKVASISHAAGEVQDEGQLRVLVDVNFLCATRCAKRCQLRMSNSGSWLTSVAHAQLRAQGDAICTCATQGATRLQLRVRNSGT